MKLIKWIDWKTAQEYENWELEEAADLEEAAENFTEMTEQLTARLAAGTVTEYAGKYDLEEAIASTRELTEKFVKHRAKMTCDAKRVKEYRRKKDKAWNIVVRYMKEKKLQFTGIYHQGGEYGIPIFDNNFVLILTQRSWGSLMCEVMDDNSCMGYVPWAYNYHLEHEERYPDPSMFEQI